MWLNKSCFNARAGKCINHNISSVSFHSIYKSWTHSWLEWFFRKSDNTSEAPSSEANFHLLAHFPFLFSISPYLTPSRSLSQLLNPSLWNLNLVPTIWLSTFFPPANVVLFNPPLPLCLFSRPSSAENFVVVVFPPRHRFLGRRGRQFFDGKKNLLHSHFTGCSSWHQQSVCGIISSVLHLYLLGPRPTLLCSPGAQQT